MRCNKAFTIVEVLLAVVIFGIVAAAVYRVFSVAVQVNGRVDRVLKMDLGVLSAVRALESDLNNIVLYHFASGSNAVQGSSRNLAVVVGREDGVVVVGYWIDEEGNFQRSQALPEDSLSAVDDAPRQNIVSGLKEASFSFGYLRSDDNEHVVWQDSWETDGLPFAVRWNADGLERTIIIPHGEWGNLI
jgi:prepilin-type N-terminal cleavage/methylation domain-containing protein